jgi:hypothetical protein
MGKASNLSHLKPRCRTRVLLALALQPTSLPFQKIAREISKRKSEHRQNEENDESPTNSGWEVERYPNRWLHRRKAPPVGDKNYDEIKIERKI